MRASNWRTPGRTWARELAEFPWRQMAGVLYRRFREARLGLSASSLTFTTVLALVPLFTVGLAVFSVSPVFADFHSAIQRWLVESLVPDAISRQVLGALTQFSRKASRLGALGLVALLLSALALVATIERTLAQIWRVHRQRPLAQRVTLYWAAITLGPVVLGSSLFITSYVVSASRGVVDGLGGLRWLLDSLEFVLLVLSVAGLYFYVPYTRVRWRHAFTAALFAVAGIALGKKLLTVYLASIPAYSAIYGAFAVVPIFLIWIYLAWLIVLLGAVLAASLPQLGPQAWREPTGPAWPFRLALEVLAQLQVARTQHLGGLSPRALARRLRVAPAEVDAVLRVLNEIDWVGALQDDARGRQVLLVEAAHTKLAPLAERLLLAHDAAGQAFWAATGLAQLCLSDALPKPPSPERSTANDEPQANAGVRPMTNGA